METATLESTGNSKMKKFLPIGIGIVLSLIILVLGFGMVQNVFTSAANQRPRDVVVSDITQNSAKVTWTTDKASQALVEYGTSPTTMNFNAPETERVTTHAVEITLLSPATTYYFRIKVGDKSHDNGGIPWQFTTKSTQDSQPLTTITPSPATTSTPAATLTPSASGSCNETDCTQIKSKLGKGCTTQDYFKCVRKLTPTP